MEEVSNVHAEQYAKIWKKYLIGKEARSRKEPIEKLDRCLKASWLRFFFSRRNRHSYRHDDEKKKKERIHAVSQKRKRGKVIYVKQGAC
jgi:hypothetical protein